MDKLDLTKAYKSYYTAGTAVELVHIEDALFLTIIGQGDPDGDVFGTDVEALYTVAYAIKFINKHLEKDFVVSKLEGYWWVDDQSVDPLTIPRHLWRYQLMIRMPEYVQPAQLVQAVTTTEKKKSNPRLRSVDLKKVEGGRAVQVMHMGPYSEEPASLAKMDAYMKKHYLQYLGPHHEIYLSDPRRIVPGKQKTILRHAVK
ncbi:GyrI-like domain-containing protein [Chitinophaga sp. Hz27]|uniref:GyrI-like domain-containing protein n=1 Tax=Chitinophaga sp. Hz27 TaxID=3347169 RepID=UPI0035D997E5